MSAASNRRVAVVIPCLNEELTIGRVLDGFRTSLPGADLYVIDNNSSDKTRQVAAEHGAVVLRETRPGKGFAVRQPFQNQRGGGRLPHSERDLHAAARLPPAELLRRGRNHLRGPGALARPLRDLRVHPAGHGADSHGRPRHRPGAVGPHPDAGWRDAHGPEPAIPRVGSPADRAGGRSAQGWAELKRRQGLTSWRPV